MVHGLAEIRAMNFNEPEKKAPTKAEIRRAILQIEIASDMAVPGDWRHTHVQKAIDRLRELFDMPRIKVEPRKKGEYKGAY